MTVHWSAMSAREDVAVFKTVYLLLAGLIGVMAHKSMETILIEQVNNGFIVHPFQASSQWSAMVQRENVSIFKTVDELLAGLPAKMGL